MMTVGWEHWLAAHAAVRGPVPLNVIWGCTDAVDATRDRLQLLASNVESGIRQLARLTRPKWDRVLLRRPLGGTPTSGSTGSRHGRGHPGDMCMCAHCGHPRP